MINIYVNTSKKYRVTEENNCVSNSRICEYGVVCLRKYYL